ncbi:MAG TPA: hypothetical protein PK156_31925 [Polyangium sp.]|nr:hypothetical protein [Polyangium sp.]
MHRAVLARFAPLSILVTLFSGCGDDSNQQSTTSSSSSSSTTSSSSSGDFVPYTICAEQHSRTDGVIICDKPFDTPPYVHLPPAAGLNDYMVSDCASLWDRSGNARTTIQGPLCDGANVDEARLHAFSIYEVTLCGDSVDGPCGSGQPDAVWQFARYAVIDEKAFLAPFASSSAEGKISLRKADGSFELTPTLPIRISFGAPTVAMMQDDGTSAYRLDATVNNLTEGATAADGTCLAPLSAADSANPFGAATQVSLTLTRVPSMHGAGDDEAVVEFFADGTSLGTDMAPSWFIGPKQLIATTPLAPGNYDAFGHGTPGAIPNLVVDLVSSGGTTCTP